MGERRRKQNRLFWILLFLLISTQILLFNLAPAGAQEYTLYTIKPDGSIDPPSAPVQQSGNVYLLLDNITLPANKAAFLIQKGSIVIDGNGHEIKDGYSTPVILFDDNYFCRSVTIRNLVVKNCTTVIDENGSDGPNYQDNVAGLTLTNNHFINGSIILWWTASINITNNEFNSIGVAEYYVSNCIVTKNMFAGDSYFGIRYSSASTNALVTDNTGSTRGFTFGGLRDVFVYNNTLVGPGTYDSEGINAYSSVNVTIKGNSLENFGRGIQASQIPGCVVSENKVSNIVNDDIWVSECDGAQVSKNLLTGKGGGGNRGIFAQSNCTIWDNVISNHQHGITVDSYPTLPYCKIYHNHLINNTYQARISSGQKPPEGRIIWDNDYPSGGNYWSDHSNIDLNYDGIADLPYELKGDNRSTWGGRDRFPLRGSPYDPGAPVLEAYFNYTIGPTFEVSFDGSLSYGSNPIVKYEWDFGDGTTATGIKVTHAYNASGTSQTRIFASSTAASPTYDVALTVTDSKGSTNRAQRTIAKGNFLALEIEPVQAYRANPTDELGLIQDKATDFWIQCSSTFPTAMKTSIKIETVGFSPNSTEFNYTITPGYNEFYVGQVTQSSPFFRPWMDLAFYKFTIDPYNFTPETVETDNTPAEGYYEIRVNRTKPLRILFVPVRFKNEDGYPGVYTGYSRASLMEHAIESIAYVKATYPIPDNRYNTVFLEGDFTISCTNSPVTVKNSAGDEIERPKTKDEADDALVSIAQNLAGRAGYMYDRVVGVVRADWFTTIPGYSYVDGYMVEYILASSVVTLGNWAVTPHEIGHSYNLTDNNYGDDGYYVLGRTEVNDAQTWMSSGAIVDPPVEPKYRRPVPYFWVSDVQFEEMFKQIKYPNDPEILSFSADFWRNGTVKLGELHRYPEGFPTNNDGDAGNYSLVLLDGSNRVLETVGFNVSFDNVLHDSPATTFNRVPITFTIPYANATKTIQVRDKLGNVVASKTVSVNAPSVRVISPNGGETMKSQTAQISWTASDQDGDPLTYDLLVSKNGGFTWDPVATGLKQTTYNLILTGFSGGDKYLVKVIAGDGVNTAEDVSDSHFTIASFTATVVSVPQTTRARGTSYYLLNITSYGGFSSQITLNATSSTTNRLSFAWDGGATITPVVNGSSYILLGVQTLTQIQGGNHTLYLSGTSGNNTETAVAYLYVEPFGSITVNNGAAYTNSTSVTLELTAIETKWGQVRFSNDGVGWSSWENPTTSKDWTLLSGNGPKTICYLVQDDNGLTETYNATIILDASPPVANAGLNQNVQVGTKAGFNGSGSTDNSGIASYLWDFGDGATGSGVAPTHNYTNAGTYTVRLTVIDVAGNSAASTITVTATGVIPEFSSVVILITLMILSLAVSLALRKERESRRKAWELY
jgi:PKD repeat protein